MPRLTTVPIETELGNKTLYRDIASRQTKSGKTSVAYYSGIDAEIYFDDTYIDEITQIQFQVQQNVMPLIGYNSYTYDQLAVGSRIISGSFAINFTEANYLSKVLESLSDSIIGAKNFTAQSSEGTSQNLANFQNNSLSASMNNALFAQRHSPLWKKTFDIVMSYGDAMSTKSPYSTSLTITGVQLVSCQQQLTYEGEPIMEFYTFVANDIYTTPDLSYNIVGEATNDQIFDQFTPSSPDFSDFEYNEGETDSKVYGNLKFKNQSPKGIVIEKMLIDFKSLGINSSKEVQITADTTSFTYSAIDAVIKAIHNYQTPEKREFKIKVTCQYKNGQSNSVYSEEEYIVKIGTLLDN